MKCIKILLRIKSSFWFNYQVTTIQCFGILSILGKLDFENKMWILIPNFCSNNFEYHSCFMLSFSLKSFWIENWISKLLLIQPFILFIDCCGYSFTKFNWHLFKKDLNLMNCNSWSWNRCKYVNCKRGSWKLTMVYLDGRVSAVHFHIPKTNLTIMPLEKSNYL